jgi:hypothetical protein
MIDYKYSKLLGWWWETASFKVWKMSFSKLDRTPDKAEINRFINIKNFYTI